jgi:hypothetical protein
MNFNRDLTEENIVLLAKNISFMILCRTFFFILVDYIIVSSVDEGYKIARGGKRKANSEEKKRTIYEPLANANA